MTTTQALQCLEFQAPLYRDTAQKTAMSKAPSVAWWKFMGASWYFQHRKKATTVQVDLDVHDQSYKL